jgi:hypothetical protein
MTDSKILEINEFEILDKLARRFSRGLVGVKTEIHERVVPLVWTLGSEKVDQPDEVRDDLAIYKTPVPRPYFIKK